MVNNQLRTPVPQFGAVNFKQHTTNQPEWARVDDITKMFGIKRSRLYQLLQNGQIKSVALRQRNCTKGIRIINCDSVRLFLESLASKEAK